MYYDHTVSPANKPEKLAPGHAPETPEVENAQEYAQRYLQVNQRITELMPSTLELCRLLHQVKHEELFRYAEPPYDSFLEWVAAEHHLAKSSVYQYLNAGRVCKLIESTAVDSRSKPENQAQLRPLLSLDDKQVIEVWSVADKLARMEPEAGKVITEKTVAKAKRRVLGKKASAPKDLDKRLEKALAAIWTVWPVEEKSRFIYLLRKHLGDYFSRLDASDFKNQSDYLRFQRNLSKPNAV